MRCRACRLPLTSGTYCLDCDERRPSAINYERTNPYAVQRFRHVDASMSPAARNRRLRTSMLGLAAWHRMNAATFRDERDGAAELHAARRRMSELRADVRVPVLP